jgi:hypothetical protein
VRGDGADLAHGFAELAVVEFLAAGGVGDLDQTADLVGAVAARLNKTGFLKSGVGVAFIVSDPIFLMAPKAVVGAAMRKLAHLIYGVVKSGKPFDANFPMNGVAIQDGI